MAEVAHAGEHHGHAALVGGVDHFLVAHRAAGLGHAGCARIDHHVQAVAEGEEGIAGDHGVLQRELGRFGLDAGNAGRVQARHLACAHAHGHAALAEADGVALDLRGHLPGSKHGLHFLKQ